MHQQQTGIESKIKKGDGEKVAATSSNRLFT